VPDSYEVDDEGRPVAEGHSEAESEPAAEAAPAPDPTVEQAAMRRQIEQTLRFMRLQTAIGIVVILALIIFMSSIRGVLVLVLVIFTFSSLGAYWWLRRNLNARLGGQRPGA
jgi:ABC-type bacteriocin/lantibiotic exporter with double-glycine peptidase domain